MIKILEAFSKITIKWILRVHLRMILESVFNIFNTYDTNFKVLEILKVLHRMTTK